MAGEEVVTYRVVSHEDRIVDTAIVTIVIEGDNNQLPEAHNDQFNVNEDTTASLNVLQNDQDTDGELNEVQIVNNPTFGTINKINEDKVVVYTPNKDFYGNESGWSELTITVPRSKLTNLDLLDWFFERFPILQLVFQRLGLN